MLNPIDAYVPLSCLRTFAYAQNGWMAHNGAEIRGNREDSSRSCRLIPTRKLVVDPNVRMVNPFQNPAPLKMASMFPLVSLSNTNDTGSLQKKTDPFFGHLVLASSRPKEPTLCSRVPTKKKKIGEVLETGPLLVGSQRETTYYR